jgi:hypothetical protein
MATIEELQALIRETPLSEYDAQSLASEMLTRAGLPYNIWMTGDIESHLPDDLSDEDHDALVEAVKDSYEWRKLADFNDQQNEALSQAVAEAVLAKAVRA